VELESGNNPENPPRATTKGARPAKHFFWGGGSLEERISKMIDYGEAPNRFENDEGWHPSNSPLNKWRETEDKTTSNMKHGFRI